MRLTRGTLQPSLYERIDRMSLEDLELFAAVLERASQQQGLDPEEVAEDDILGLLDQIDAPKPPTMVEVIQSLDTKDLQAIVETAPTPTDKYLAQAEILTRLGQLEEPRTTNTWPVDYDKVYAWRQRELVLYQQDPAYFEQRKAFYASGVEGCIAFINHWIDTHDPRNAGLYDEMGRRLPVTLPLVLFERQEHMVRFMFACMEAEADGLIEKSRDMGATWVAVAVSVWAYLFWGAVTIGWGSATAVKLDRSGDAGSIFYKIRDTVRGLPACFKPKGLVPKVHLLDKRVSNPENGAGIVGEVGDEVGRGSRTRVYIVDEAAHFEHPEAVAAALSDTTRVRIDISSVSGLGTVFHRMRQGGVVWEVGQAVVRGRTNVLILDWSHHPAKTRDWYRVRQEKFEGEGLAHIFAQEVDRDYSAALTGTIIPKKWLEACVDAHLKIGQPEEWEEGAWLAGLDVADAGLDTNAFVGRKGWVVKVAEQWGERDTARTTRRMLELARQLPRMVAKRPHEVIEEEGVLVVVYYDSIGVGAGVKAEGNRLVDDGLFPPGISMAPWSGGSKVQYPGKRIIPNDEGSPKNKDYYANLKAQGWWTLRMRVYRTFKAVIEGEMSSIDDMISFDSKAIGKWLYKLIEELAQPTAKPDTRMRLVVDKTPEGAKSPNFGDACVMCCFPLGDSSNSAFVRTSVPVLVNAASLCLQCGSGSVHDLRMGRYQCMACGHVGSWDEGNVKPRLQLPASDSGSVQAAGRASTRFAVGAGLLKRRP